MKIYVLGAGGIGGYFGGLLAKAGNDITFVARNEHGRVMREKGLMIKSVIGNFTIKVKVINSISKIINPDFILFTVKTYDTEKCARKLNNVVNDDTVIITFQNGVSNDFEIKKYIDHCCVYPGVAYIISTKTAPGIIEQTGGLRKIIFGDRSGQKNAKLEKMVRIMTNSGINAVLSENIIKEIWKKYIFIVAFSGMTALYKKPIGEILSDPQKKTQYEDCVKEAIKVAKAYQVDFKNDVFENVMKTTIDTNPQSKSSLLVDIENHRRNEIETLNGELVRLAKIKNIPTPVNSLILNTVNFNTRV